MIHLRSPDLQPVWQGKHGFGCQCCCWGCVCFASDDTCLRFLIRVSTTYGGDILPNAPCRVKFSPKRPPGVHLEVTRRSETRSFIRALDMFMMFFTAEMISTICAHTNKYAWMKIFEKPSYAESDGSWLEVTAPEMLRFIALLIYMGTVKPRYIEHGHIELLPISNGFYITWEIACIFNFLFRTKFDI